MADNYRVVAGVECMVCSKCGQTKPLTDFYTDSRRKYGVRGICKECSDKEHAEYNKAHPEKNREYSSRYYHEKAAADPNFVKQQYRKNAECIVKSTKRWQEKVKQINNSESMRGARGAAFVSVVCTHCGKTYTIPKSTLVAKQNRTKGEPKFFCSVECTRAYRIENSKDAQRDRKRIDVEQFIASRHIAET